MNNSEAIKKTLEQLAQRTAQRIGRFVYAYHHMPKSGEVENFFSNHLKKEIKNGSEHDEYYEYGMDAFRKEYQKILQYPDYKAFVEEESERLRMPEANMETVEVFLLKANHMTKEYLCYELIGLGQLEKIKLFSLDKTGALVAMIKNKKEILDYMLSIPAIYNEIDSMMASAVHINNPYRYYLVEKGASPQRWIERYPPEEDVADIFDDMLIYEKSLKIKKSLEAILPSKDNLSPHKL